MIHKPTDSGSNVVPIRREGEGYALTRYGAELFEALAPLDVWAREWARRS